ncbi:MAG: type II secretion system major pseudopilin GspG [Patescibacteria group bacterium]
MRRSERGFSLIEITAVLLLMAAFAVIVAPQVIRSVEKGRVNAGKSQIQSLKSVLNQYKLENGAYPTTEQGLDALYEKPTVPPVPENWDGPYVEDPVKEDPWHHPLVYRCPGLHNKNGYDLMSYGADGVEGGTGYDADITNWTQTR